MVLRAVVRIMNYMDYPWFSTSSNHGGADREGKFHIASILATCFYSLQKDNHRGFRAVADDFSPLVPKVITPFGGKTAAIYGIPYRADADIKQFYADCKTLQTNHKKYYKAKKYDVEIILMHQGIKEAKVQNAPFQLEKNISAKKLAHYFKWADLIVAGHFHDPQRLHKRFIIPGAICQHSFKDCGGKRGCWIYDSETKESTFYPIKSPKFWQLDFEKRIRSATKKDLEALKANEGDYVRILITNSSEIDTARSKLGKKGYNLSFKVKPKKGAQELRDSTMSFTLDDYDLLTKYIENKKPTELNEKTIRKFGKLIIKQAMERGK